MVLTYRAVLCPLGPDKKSRGAWAPSEYGVELWQEQGAQPLEASGWGDGGAREAENHPGWPFTPREPQPLEACVLCRGPPDLLVFSGSFSARGLTDVVSDEPLC